MTRSRAGQYVRILGLLRSGSLEAVLDDMSVAQLDATKKEAKIDVQLLVITHARAAKFLSREGLGVLGLPGLLSKKGWKLTFVHRGRKVLEAGNGVSALTGHVSVSVPELLRLRKLFRS